MQNLKIGTKIILGFISVLLLFAITLTIIWFNVQNIADGIVEIEEETNHTITSQDLIIHIEALYSHVFQYQVYTDKADRDEVMKEFKEHLGSVQKDLGYLLKKTDTQEQEDILNEIASDMIFLDKMMEDEIAIVVDKGEKASIQKLYDNVKEMQDEMLDDLRIVNNAYMTDLASKSEEVHKNTDRSFLPIIIGSIVSILVGVGIAVYITFIIRTPLLAIVEHAKILSKSDFRKNLSDKLLKSRDEIGILSNVLNQLTVNMREIINTISANASHTASMSEELSASAQQTGEAANQIAVTIGEVADGITEQLKYIQNILNMMETNHSLVNVAEEKINLTLNVSNESMEAVQEGQQAMKELVSQLEDVENTVNKAQDSIMRLGAHSKEISSIIEVITSISEQTNLLALNAAIEAARAGEHGKGFAVVADEVRKLADESARSANKITELIQIIQKETDINIEAIDRQVGAVKSQRQIVERNNVNLDKIAEKVQFTKEFAEEIKNVSEQIKTNSDEVLKAVQESSSIIEQSSASAQQVAASAQEQSATVEEVSASANELAKISESLNENMQRFKV